MGCARVTWWCSKARAPAGKGHEPQHSPIYGLPGGVPAVFPSAGVVRGVLVVRGGVKEGDAAFGSVQRRLHAGGRPRAAPWPDHAGDASGAAGRGHEVARARAAGDWHHAGRGVAAHAAPRPAGRCTGFALALTGAGGLLRGGVVGVAALGADAETLGRIQGRTQSMMFIATLVAGFIGGVLFDHEMHWAFYAGIGASIASMVLVLFIAEPPPQAAAMPAGVPAALPELAKLKLTRNQTTWVGFYAITRGFTLAPFIGLLPLHFALQNVDPYLFGLVLGLFTLGGFVVALWGAPMIAWLGPQGGVWVTFGGIVGSLALFATSDMLEHHGISIFSSSLVGISLLGIAAGAIRSVVTTRLDLQQLTMPQRILVFGRMERQFGYLSAFLLICFGQLVERFSITVTFACTVLALLATVAASAAWLALTTPDKTAAPGPMPPGGC